MCGFVILFVFVWICFVREILKEALTSCVMSCSQRFGRTSPLLMMEIHRIPNDEYFVKPRSLLWNILSPPYEYFVSNNEFTTCWNSQWLGFKNVWVKWPNRICHKSWYSQNIMICKELKLKKKKSFPGLHKEFPPQGSQANPHWGEALQLLLAWVRLEICQVGHFAFVFAVFLYFLIFSHHQVRRANKASPKAHRQQAVPMSPLWSHFCQEWPS